MDLKNKKCVTKAALKCAFPYTIPIFAGFCFLGLTYGIYMNTSGFSFWYPMLTSLTIFAGSIEFVTVNMILGAFNPIQAFTMTLMINARHLFYGISMLDKFKGTGKSFFAGCIANALLDRDIPVLMTNFPSILTRLTGMFSEDRAEFIASLGMYDLLIIDDLGVERNTKHAMEQMFHVIDCRYRSRKPMIITTNLKLEEIKNPPDLAHARIYDRILERCAPVLFAGKNFREENAEATKAAAKEIVSPK